MANTLHCLLWTLQETKKILQEYKKSWSDRLCIHWVNWVTKMECMRIKPDNRCSCGHALKSHEWYDRTQLHCGCRCPGCSCKAFDYLPSQGSWTATCICKHLAAEHYRVAPSHRTPSGTRSHTQLGPRSQARTLREEQCASAFQSRPNTRLGGESGSKLRQITTRTEEKSLTSDFPVLSRDSNVILQLGGEKNGVQETKHLTAAAEPESLMAAPCAVMACLCKSFMANFSCRCGYSARSHRTVVELESHRKELGKDVDTDVVNQKLAKKQKNGCGQCVGCKCMMPCAKSKK
eukprot:GHVT01104894.1.p1 GENE.GHVT01104894.1~~GHVT01104894.1.p1  ORF type:complete len:291 (+),score=1.11 GHVT01104894.1:769-1641(+)